MFHSFPNAFKMWKELASHETHRLIWGEPSRLVTPCLLGEPTPGSVSSDTFREVLVAQTALINLISCFVCVLFLVPTESLFPSCSDRRSWGHESFLFGTFAVMLLSSRSPLQSLIVSAGGWGAPAVRLLGRRTRSPQAQTVQRSPGWGYTWDS